MKSVSAGLLTHLQGSSLTLATLWRVTRRDGAVFTFTDHPRDIVYGGDTYAAALGYQRSAVSSGSELAVDEGEVLGMINAASITESDLRAGLWDGAAVRIFVVNYASIADGEMKIRRGTLGEVTVRDDGSFRAELRGMAQPLNVTVGSFYQPECRADLGDSRCGINLAFGAGWTQASSIATVAASTALILANDGIGSFVDTWFDGGVLIWTSGANTGVAREILGWNGITRTVELLGPPPFAPAPGDAVRLQPGCDKRRLTCRTKFSNALNHRGEPTLPGVNALIRTPASA